MDPKEVFENLKELESLETKLAGKKPEFDNPDFSRQNELMEKLEFYVAGFTLDHLKSIYKHAQDQVTFTGRYNQEQTGRG